jgi:hypothetical protein
VEKKLQSIVQRFPFRIREIERLAKEDGTFLGICEDYVDAEAALEHWNAAPPCDVTEARRSEYVTLVEELAVEIEEILDAAIISKR